MEQVLADKADAMLAGCQRLMTLLPQHRPVPKLEGIGAGLWDGSVKARPRRHLGTS
jgi:hypothetical protein